jgi:glycosidase
VADDYATVNVAVERDDPTSVLAMVRRLLDLRRSLPALSRGEIHTLDADTPNVFAYTRDTADQRILVALNMGAEPRTIDLSPLGETGTVLCATGMDRAGTIGLSRITLGPNEGLLIRVISG